MTYVVLPEEKPAWRVKCEMCGAIADPDTRRIRHVATTPVPTEEQIEEWLFDGSECEATDGCYVELDGRCEHGHVSWMRRLGLI